jgi:hypothetical protein
MSIASVFSLVQTRLMTASAVGQPAIVRVHLAPPEQTNLGDFPCAILKQAQPYTIEYSPNGYFVHRYTVEIFLFVGALGTTPLPDLETRGRAWEYPIAQVLTQDLLKIVGDVLTLGDERDTLGLQCAIGEIQYGDATSGGNFYGLTMTLPVMERYNW